MKGPKDSKESHTSVTMEGMAGVGRGMQVFVCAERVNYRALCAHLEPAGTGGSALFRMLGACGSPPAPAQLLPARGCAGSRAEGAERCRSRAERQRWRRGCHGNPRHCPALL